MVRAPGFVGNRIHGWDAVLVEGPGLVELAGSNGNFFACTLNIMMHTVTWLGMALFYKCRKPLTCVLRTTPSNLLCTAQESLD
mmetsp:Transcript_82225/g.137455  ORF Transcript_82225/g.137455 Transcript_82225/m.137455 type:complete len:83 (+) Transcript_82225:1379-1627(+)